MNRGKEEYKWQSKLKKFVARPTKVLTEKYQLKKIHSAKQYEVKYMFLPAPRAGENVSRKARTVNAFIRTLFLVYTQKEPSVAITTEKKPWKSIKMEL